MSAIAEPVVDSGDRLAKRNALVLAVAQALAGGNSVVIVGTAGIVGSMLADKALRHRAGEHLCARHVDRRRCRSASSPRDSAGSRAFELGALCGAIAGLLCCLAVLQASFALLCVGTLFGGFYASVHQSYRFAAADTASDAFKAKAISWVMAGGMFSAFVGPQLVIVTKDLWPPYLFAASYLAQAGVAILSGLVLLLTRIPRLVADGPAHAGRPAADRDLSPAAPDRRGGVRGRQLFDDEPGDDLGAGRDARLQPLGHRRDARPAMARGRHVRAELLHRRADRPLRHRPRSPAAGSPSSRSARLIALTGITIWHFWAALVLLGVGWNFAFVGATALVTQCHRPNERNKVQAVNDFLVFGSMAIGSFSSGKLLARLRLEHGGRGGAAGGAWWPACCWSALT